MHLSHFLHFFIYNASWDTKKEETDNVCYENATIWLETLDDIRFAVETIALPSVGSLGVMGNILVIITLIKLTKSKKENKNQTNFDRLLIFLSATDTLFLIMHIIDAIIQAQNHSEPMWYQVSSRIIFYINNCISSYTDFDIFVFEIYLIH